MHRYTIAELLQSENFLQEINIKGWVRTFRSNRFIALNDGSTIKNIQCVIDFENTTESVLKKINTGAAVSITGTLMESQGKGQTVEIKVSEIEILSKLLNWGKKPSIMTKAIRNEISTINKASSKTC